MILTKAAFSSGASVTELGWVGPNASISSTGGRFGGGFIRKNTPTVGDRTLSSPSWAIDRTRIGLHLSFRFDRLNIILFQIREGSTVHIDVRVSSNGRLFVTRAGTQISPEGATVLTPNAWYGLEIWLEISDTAGVVRIWLNGNLTPEINLTGVDTRNGASGLAQNMFLDGAWVVDLCDFVVYDDLGTVNNVAPLGDLRVEYVMPNGNGAASDFVGSDGNSIDNFLLVDEMPVNHDTDFVESATAGAKDTYEMGGLAVSTGNVLAVGAVLFARKTDAGTRQIVPVYRLAGGAEADGALMTLGSSYASLSEVAESRPGGGAYTIADVNGMQVGVKVAL